MPECGPAGGSGDYAVYFGPLPQAFGSPTEHLDRPGRAVIADFLRKVLKLGLLRMADLCDRMDFDPLDRQDILTQASPLFPSLHSCLEPLIHSYAS